MKRIVKLLLSLPFILAASALALYALAGFVAAPWYIKRALPDYLRENLNATGSVGEVRVNPFIFTLEARDFALTESGGKTPAIAVERLFVDFELSSLFRRAWTFAAITVERPRVNLEIDAKDTLNLSKLAPANKVPAKEADTSPALPRLLLQHLEIKQGSAAVTDLGIPGKASTWLEPIEFQLRDLSTLPDYGGDYTLTAKLPAGGTLGWRGSLKLAPIASTGRIEVRDLKLATVWSFLQDKLLIESPAGSVDLSFGYNTRYAENKLDATADGLALKISALEFKQHGQQEVALRVGDAALRGGVFNLGSRSMRFAELAANKLFAHTIIDENGSVNWSKLVAPSPDTPAGAPWQIAIDAVNVSEMALRTDDHGFVKPLTFDVERAGLKAAVKIATGPSPSVVVDGIAVDLNGILAREAGTKEALLTLGAMNFAGGSFDLAQRKLRVAELALTNGRANIATDAARRATLRQRAADALESATTDDKSAVPWQIVIDVVSASEFSLQALAQGYTRPLTFEIARAAARAGVNIEVGTALKLDVDALAVDLSDVRVAEAGTKEILVSLGSANLAGGKFSLAQNRFSADTLKLAKANAQLIRDAAGSINLASALTPKTAPAPPPSNTKPVAVEIRAFELTDGTAALLDRGIEPALTMDLQGIRILARGVNSAGTQPMTLDATLRIKQGGTVRAQGSVTPARQRASLRVETKDVAFAPLEALVAKHTTLKLKSGTASSTGQIEWNGAGKSTDLRYTGSATIDALQLDEEASGERFAAWKQLLAEDMNIDLAGRSARIGDLRLNAPAGKIIIAKDRSTNLSGVLRKSTSSPAAPPGAPTPATTVPTADESFVVNAERMHVTNGELDFADYSLVLPFATVIREMNGNVTGLSTQPGTRASVKLEGRVDEFGQAQVSGSINLLEPKVFTDLAVTFRNVALSPLSPYSATFAGRRIASGKLSLDLQYKINNGQLAGENKILLEQFTLGERVESPTAVNLPLDLAIALLTDSSGKIDLSVPVRGNVDAPEFSYSHVVWQAIRTVITNIVTAPFRALASLFGGGTEKVDAIAFDAGRAQLAPPEREKLVKIANVLKQRPNLKLMVQGRYDSRYDGAALRTQATHRLLAERLGAKLADSDDTALPNYDNAKTQRAIEALYEERAGSGSVDKFKTEHEKKTGKEVKRVNAALALIGRGSPDREFYDALLSRAAELHTLADAQLQTLATQRGSAIVEQLKVTGGLDAARFAASAVAKMDAEKASEITAALTLAPLK